MDIFISEKVLSFTLFNKFTFYLVHRIKKIQGFLFV